MPTRELKRIWCKTCNEFMLHNYKFPNTDKWFCNECGTLYSSVLLKDIPFEKIKEQRERYKQATKNSLFDYLGAIGKNPFEDMFKDDVRIVESDAGQKTIDEKNRQERIKLLEKQRRERAERLAEAKKYKHLGRNDICICGSGKKYKKCCLERIKTSF